MSEDQARRIVVDASIAVKWVNPSEEFGNIAEKVLQDYEQGKLSFAVPEFLYYEVASGISKATARSNITKEEGLEALNGILDMEMERYSCPDVRAVYSFSQAYRRSIYDCIYLVLAENLGVVFLTADRKLYDAVSGRIEFIMWIEDYCS